MHTRPTLIASALALAFTLPAQADNDIANLRAEIQAMRQSYEARIQALEDRLKHAEAKADSAQANAEQASAVAQAAAQSATPPAAANSFNPELGLILQGRYADLDNIASRHITGFLPVAATPAGLSRGFSTDASELSIAANIDPWLRGYANIVYADDAVEVEEAYFQTLALGHGLTLKGGRFRSALGYMNEQHPHQWDFIDNPLMYQALFGEGYLQNGVQAKWIAPTDLLLEVTADVGRGASFPGSDRDKNGANAATLGVHLGGDLGLSHSWRAGVSYLRTRADQRAFFGLDPAGVDVTGSFTGRSRAWLADLVWKWAPDGNPRDTHFKFQAEWFQRKESGSLACADADAANPSACAANPSGAYASDQSGWYAEGLYQFMPRWRVGYRHDRLEWGTASFLGADPGATIASLARHNPRKHSLMLDFVPSEYSLFRLQYARDESMLGWDENQLSLQYILSLGAHGAHKF